MADDVFEDIVVFSGEPAQHILHGEEPLLSIIDLCGRQDGDENETHRQKDTKIERHPDTPSWHINTSNDSGKRPEVKEKKREGRQTVHTQFQYSVSPSLIHAQRKIPSSICLKFGSY